MLNVSNNGKRPRRHAARRRVRDFPLRVRLVFFALLIVLPLVILGSIEGALRLAGFGGYPPTFVRVGALDNGSDLIFTDARGPASYFFTSRSQGLALDPVAFESPKPDNTFRVMWVGESAAKGIPQPRPLRASAFLETMLSDLWPQRDVEVINVGVPGIGAYPVLEVLTDSLAYEPDVVVAYLGNNEFYGAFGVTSLHTAGRSPFMIRGTRAVRSTAIAQAIDRSLRGRVVKEPGSLMEAMVGQSHIAMDDPARTAAARNLRTFISDMIDRCRARGVPIIVCTPPCNEAGMAPLGEFDLTSMRAEDRDRVAALLTQAESTLTTEADAAEHILRDLIELAPHHARAHYLLGRALHAQGRFAEASRSFRKAVDLDPMPWRPPTTSVDAIRAAAASRGAVLADLDASFHEAAEDGCVGWELISDHVHPSLRGQVLVAKTVAQAMCESAGLVPFDAEAIRSLPDWEAFAERQGANEYERYAVAHSMRLFGSIPFFAGPTPEMVDRNSRVCQRIESQVHPLVLQQMRVWVDPGNNMVDRFPISGLVGDAMIKLDRTAEAQRLYDFAARSSVPYGSRRFEFVLRVLLAEADAEGAIGEPSRILARRVIEQGQFLIRTGRSTSGHTETVLGQVHQLLGEHLQAIASLKAAQAKVAGSRRMLVDQRLLSSYVATGQSRAAQELLETSLQRFAGSTSYASHREAMLGILESSARGP